MDSRAHGDRAMLCSLVPVICPIRLNYGKFRDKPLTPLVPAGLQLI